MTSLSQIAKGFINKSLNDIDAKHTKLDEEAGRPKIFTEERQQEKWAFANTFPQDSPEYKFASYWIREQ